MIEFAGTGRGVGFGRDGVGFGGDGVGFGIADGVGLGVTPPGVGRGVGVGFDGVGLGVSPPGVGRGVSTASTLIAANKATAPRMERSGRNARRGITAECTTAPVRAVGG